MAIGLGETFRSSVLNYVFRATAVPGAATFYISLHTADPGNDAASAAANEVTITGTGYVRQSVTRGAGWNAATAANPNVVSNAAIIAYATASANYTSTANPAGTPQITHFGVWTHVSNTGAADYVGRALVSGTVSVASGNTPSFAISALQLNIDAFTSGSTTGMSQAFRQALYEYIFRAGTDPLAALGTLFTSLHTGDPGATSTTALANEASGGSYARASITRTTGGNFAAAVNGSPSYISNSTTAVTFPLAGVGGYSTGTAMVAWSIWRVSTTGSGADYMLRGTMTSQSVVAGNTPSFAISGGTGPAGPGRLFTQLDQT